MKALRTAGRLLWITIEQSFTNNNSLLAAGLTFYTLLSLAPALWIIVGVAGAIFGPEHARAEVINRAGDLAGPAAARLVRNLPEQMPTGSAQATVASLLSMFFGATMGFGALQDSLNRIWGVRPSRRSMVASFFMKRLLSFGVVIIVGLLLLASLILDAVLAGVARFLPESLPAPQSLLQAFNYAGSFVLITMLFGTIYHVLPDVKPHWRHVWAGAAFTAVLFVFGKIAVGLYLNRARLGSAYGAAGSLVVLMLWMYYSAQIFLFGAQLTVVYANRAKYLRDA
jgi:membrane protein